MFQHTHTTYGRVAGAALLLIAATALLTACSDPRADFGQNQADKVDYQPTDCDPIDPSMCALPFPSNLYLDKDESTHSGYALHFGKTSLPKGNAGYIDPTAWEGLDGYGVATPIIFKAPNLDLSQMPLETDATGSWSGDIGQAQLFEMADDGTLSRVPFFMERDAREDASTSLYYMRPLVILDENAHYVVMLRNLTDTDGHPIERSEAFDELVQGAGYADPELSGRQDHFNTIFDALEQQEDIDRQDLFLAWDFHTQSDYSLHHRMLEGRKLILDEIQANGAPTLDIDNIRISQRDDDTDRDTYDPYWQYHITGTFNAPQIVKDVPTDNPELNGVLFNTNADGDLELAGPRARKFWINIPYDAVNAATPTKLMEYGHGLLNTGAEIRNKDFGHIATQHNFIYFACNWTGMADPDTGRVLAILLDFSNIRWMTDNMHQGVLEFMILAKSMRQNFENAALPDGFALKDANHQTIADLGVDIDPDEVYYQGNSQGGIYGATYVAVSPEIDYGALDVPGQNYDFLVQRSVDFNEYFNYAIGAYNNSPSKVGVALAAIQTLWDQVDPSSYFKHINKDPFPGNNPDKAVLLSPSKGDHQVSPLTNLIVANSDDGVKLMKGWDEDVTVLGPDLKESPFVTDGKNYKGSAIVLWDVGNEWPSPGMHPYDEAKWCEGKGEDCDAHHEAKKYDPHDVPRYIQQHQDQLMHFLLNQGEVKDFCDGKGCHFEHVQDIPIKANGPSDYGSPVCQDFKAENGFPPKASNRVCYKLKD